MRERGDNQPRPTALGLIGRRIPSTGMFRGWEAARRARGHQQRRDRRLGDDSSDPETLAEWIEAFFNDAQQGYRMPLRRLHAIMEVWRRDGRDVRAYVDDDPGFRIDLPRFRVIVSPPRAAPQPSPRPA